MYNGDRIERFPESIDVGRLFPAGKRIEHKDIDKVGIVADESKISFSDVLYGAWEVPIIWDGEIIADWVSYKDLIRLT